MNAWVQTDVDNVGAVCANMWQTWKIKGKMVPVTVMVTIAAILIDDC